MKYPKLLLLPCFGLLITLIGMTNSTKAQSVEFGIKGGMNISSHLKDFLFIEDDIQLNLTPNITTGYQAGFIVRKDFSRIVRLQTEPSFILLGANYEESFTLRGNELETDSRTELLYVQLPLLLQFSTTPPQKTIYGRQRPATTYHLSTGVFGGYLLDARFTGTNTGAPLGISFAGEFSNDVTSQYSEYDAGVLFGIGLEHGLESKIGFETRALYSVIGSGNGSEISSFNPQNMAVTFSLYYLF